MFFPKGWALIQKKQRFSQYSSNYKIIMESRLPLGRSCSPSQEVGIGLIREGCRGSTCPKSERTVDPVQTTAFSGVKKGLRTDGEDRFTAYRDENGEKRAYRLFRDVRVLLRRTAAGYRTRGPCRPRLFSIAMSTRWANRRFMRSRTTHSPYPSMFRIVSGSTKFAAQILSPRATRRQRICPVAPMHGSSLVCPFTPTL